MESLVLSTKSSPAPSRPDTPASVASRQSVFTTENVLSVVNEDVWQETILVDRSFLEDPWRPDEYPLITTRGYKGKPLELREVDPLFGADWSVQQRTLYRRVEALLNVNRTARLALNGCERQFLLIKLQIDKTADKLRQIFAETRWDGKLLQWLVIALLDNLEKSSLFIFMDIFRYMYNQLPVLFEQAGLTNFAASERFRHNGEFLQTITSPLYTTINPTNTDISFGAGRPTFMLCPGDTPWAQISLKRKLEFFGNIFCCDAQMRRQRGSQKDRFAFLFRMAREQYLKLRQQSPYAPIVLVGHLLGARVAYELARREKVNAVICLGFPLQVLDDRIQSDLNGAEVKTTPTLFIIGSNSLWSPLSEMEKVKRQTPGSALHVLQGADDALQTEYRFMRMGSTQEVCDQRVTSEIVTFLRSALAKPLCERTELIEPPPKKPKISRPKKKMLSDTSGVSASEDGIGTATPSTPQPSPVTESIPTAPPSNLSQETVPEIENIK